jgi:integrase
MSSRITHDKTTGSQICVFLKEAKNLVTTTETKTVVGENPKQGQTSRGLIVNFLVQLQNENYSEETTKVYVKDLKRLLALGCDLFNPETVKQALAKLERSEARKHGIAAAYTLFLKSHSLTWNPPRFRITRKIPYIPPERDLDDLIAACPKKTATFLQTLKETALRVSEAARLQWKDIDLERKLIVMNQPSKGGTPRIFKISEKLARMLSGLHRKNEWVWGTNSKVTRGSVFYRERRNAVHKLSNPRLMKIGFHTFRHWKATMLYHQTKNPMLVKEFLGHRVLDTTLLYIQTETALFMEENDGFMVQAVKTPEDIKGLLEVGYEYVCAQGELMFFRKRK